MSEEQPTSIADSLLATPAAGWRAETHVKHTALGISFASSESELKIEEGSRSQGGGIAFQSLIAHCRGAGQPRVQLETVLLGEMADGTRCRCRCGVVEWCQQGRQARAPPVGILGGCSAWSSFQGSSDALLSSACA